MTPAGVQRPAPWLIQFFQRHPDVDLARCVPALEFLDRAPVGVAAQMGAVLSAVAAAPPLSFAGGGKWQAMHGEMAGIFEVRVRSRGMNHRLFCLLDRSSGDLAGPSIVCLGGLSKPVRSAAHPREYSRISQYAAEFAAHHQVYHSPYHSQHHSQQRDPHRDPATPSWPGGPAVRPEPPGSPRRAHQRSPQVS
jgi:hypothetical protein